LETFLLANNAGQCRNGPDKKPRFRKKETPTAAFALEVSCTGSVPLTETAFVASLSLRLHHLAPWPPSLAAAQLCSTVRLNCQHSMVSQTGQGTRTSHNLKNKQWMIQYVTKNPQQDYKLYVQAYQQQFKLKLAKGTLSKWLKQKAKINSVPVKQAAKTKHIKAPLYAELEQLVVAWLSQVGTVGLCQCQATGQLPWY
jgi:hypothetical protein